MSTMLRTQISSRDRAVLRAIAEGRCVVSGDVGNPLTIDGFRCADQFAKARLSGAGLIKVTGSKAGRPCLTATGRAVLVAA
jgi:hypothetical protein